MQYNPSVNDNRGNIIANSADNVARTTLAGYQSMADGISQAGRSVAGGIMGYGQERDRLEKESALIDGKTRAYAQMGVLSDADYAAMAKGNLAKKREILSQADAIYLDQVQRQNQGLQERKLNEDIRQFDVNHPAGWSPSAQIMEKDGTQVMVTQTSPFQGNVQALKTPATTPTPYIDPNTGQPVPGYGVLNGRVVNTNPNQMGGMMGALFGGGAVPTAPGSATPAPTAAGGNVVVGTIRTQNGRRYRYDGSEWKEIK
jgi:hypothetical protein